MKKRKRQAGSDEEYLDVKKLPADFLAPLKMLWL
jgi:hypothetical protein